MSHSPEDLTIPEIMNAPEATAYLQASCVVLGRGDVHVDNVEAARFRGPDDEPNGGEVTIITGDGITNGFSLHWEKSVNREVVSLIQGQEAENEILKVSHWTFKDKGIDRYMITRTNGEVVKGVGTVTTNDEATAEALFGSMATDFKLALERALADRKDLLDGIEWNASDILRQHQQQHDNERGARLGRLIKFGK